LHTFFVYPLFQELQAINCYYCRLPFSFKYKLKCTALASELCWKFCRGSG